MDTEDESMNKLRFLAGIGGAVPGLPFRVGHNTNWAHDGWRLTLASELGKGSVFRVRLPVGAAA